MAQQLRAWSDDAGIYDERSYAVSVYKQNFKNSNTYHEIQEICSHFSNLLILPTVKN